VCSHEVLRRAELVLLWSLGYSGQAVRLAHGDILAGDMLVDARIEDRVEIHLLSFLPLRRVAAYLLQRVIRGIDIQTIIIVLIGDVVAARRGEV
jgi:hypothetical protein